MRNKFLRVLIWIAVASLGAISLATIAFRRGESISAMWLISAALCTYAVGYRFYAKFIAARVLTIDVMRATPAERLDNGRDFVPTNKWVVFGHHFAAIAGPGPLVGPVLAAQFGYLPGTLWIIVGAVLGGCVQDFVILLLSVRRDGRSLTDMARASVGRVGGIVAFLAVLAILIILLGAVALIVVNALKGSPWGTFTIAMTIPIAMLMGLYLRRLRPGKVLETSILGFILVLLSIWGGQYLAYSNWAVLFTFSGTTLAAAIIVYGFAASALPVWLLLAPRDYLSTFVKLGTIAILAVGIIAVRPTMQMPSLTRFIDGTGPIFAGSIFPFAFITIACGAISGFHSLISSGTTPKLIQRETETRFVGYGGMMAESFVGVMAMVAACVLEPGVYFAINSPGAIVGTTSAQAATTISSWGFPLAAGEMDNLARLVGEQTLMNRTGGAPAFAVGMAHIFSRSLGGDAVMALWYHFGIMFESLFILTVLDAGTRVGRFILQEGLGHVWKPLGQTSSYPSVVGTSALMVALWGYMLWQGVIDPLGGINSMWPLFGIANQLLAIVAMCVASMILIKMGRVKWIWVTLMPLVWLTTVVFTAALQKIFHSNPRIGFLSHANLLASQAIPPGKESEIAHLIFNDRLNAGVAATLVILVSIVLIESGLEAARVLSGRKTARVDEAPFVPTRLLEENV